MLDNGRGAILAHFIWRQPCDHRLIYHSEHAQTMIVYCDRCNAQWEATMFIAPRKDGEEPIYL